MLSFDTKNVLIFSFVCAFEVLFKKFFTIQRWQRSRFSSINLIVLPFSVGSLIHSEPTSVWCQVGIKLYFFPCTEPIFPTHLVNSLFFSIDLWGHLYHRLISRISMGLPLNSLFRSNLYLSVLASNHIKKTITFNMSQYVERQTFPLYSSF